MRNIRHTRGKGIDSLNGQEDDSESYILDLHRGRLI